ncbi:hypothetical protein, partial [Bradyrhizobium elkanii]|uniref:hypothetical protein n=1 Tax=Bradyrhizobium elkanii TaxID=29448 RepID=UPI001AEBED74
PTLPNEPPQMQRAKFVVNGGAKPKKERPLGERACRWHQCCSFARTVISARPVSRAVTFYVT